MVKITNLNRRLKSPADKAVQEGKEIPNLITGPSRATQDFLRPNPFLGKFKTNPLNEDFYPGAIFGNTDTSFAAQEDIDSRVGFYGNTFEGDDNIAAQEFLNAYYQNLGGENTAEGKALIEPDRIVRPENLSQLSSQPATGGSGEADPNVSGRFPSNSVAF
jgi:hypothetical protein|tara:strand:+ start:47 stop:529 length:483 start_codon:yes stop_codon:yes gene_type:complete